MEIDKIYNEGALSFAVTLRCEPSMATVKPKITRKTILLPIVGLVAFFAYIYLFQVDIPEIIATVQRSDPRFYLIAVIISLLEIFFYTLSWRQLLDFLAVKVSIVKSYLYVWYGIYMDIIIPAESISGEISRVYLVEREQSGTSGKVVASLVTHRLMGMSINVASLILGLGILLTERQVGALIFNLTMLFTIIIVIVLLLIVLLCFREEWTLKIINGLIKLAERVSHGRWKLDKIKEEANKAVKIFHDSMKEFLRAPKTLSISLFFLILSWVISFSITYLVFVALRFPIEWSVILVTSAIVLAVKSIPIGVPFEVGLPEITMTSFYTLFGIPAEISATATILIRIVTLWLRFFIGFMAQQWLELKTVITNSDKATTEKT
jgi:uncharacterized protein (TIRG00374 family)